jgi:hypothetical protein
LESDANTSNIFKYLELGILPVRFEIIKRKMLLLQYILQQEETSMVYQNGLSKLPVKTPLKMTL